METDTDAWLKRQCRQILSIRKRVYMSRNGFENRAEFSNILSNRDIAAMSLHEAFSDVETAYLDLSWMLALWGHDSCMYAKTWCQFDDSTIPDTTLWNVLNYSLVSCESFHLPYPMLFALYRVKGQNDNDDVYDKTLGNLWNRSGHSIP